MRRVSVWMLALVVSFSAVGTAVFVWAKDPPEAAIARIPLDGQDVADGLGIHIWKFKIDLPKDVYSWRVWTEDWTKGNDTPVLAVIDLTDRGDPNGELLVKLPAATSPDYFVSLAGGSSGALATTPGIFSSASLSTEVLKKQPIKLGEDICLAAFVHNDSGSVDQGFSKLEEHAERKNDRMFFVKCRFYPYMKGAGGKPIWKDGRVQF